MKKHKPEEDIIGQFVVFFLVVILFVVILIISFFSTKDDICSLFDSNQVSLTAKITDRYVSHHRGMEIEFYCKNG